MAAVNFACAVRSDASLWCWGENTFGQLGDGTTTRRYVPTRVDDGPWTVVSGSGGHTCGIKADGTLWCWGWNAQGELGDGTTTNRPTPTRIGADLWLDIDAGSATTCGLRTDRTLWCWGFNERGQLGDGTTTRRLSPVQVGTDTWLRSSNAAEHTCAIKADESLWCWGNSLYVGDGEQLSPIVEPTPVQIDAGSWKGVSAADGHTCAIKTDDTVWCWGMGANGRLGNLDATGIVPSLVPIPAHRLAIDSGGDIWTINADGTNAVRHTTDQSAFGVAWSPDGRTVAFARTGVLDAGIWTVDVYTGLKTRITTRAYDQGAEYSPDGSQIVFAGPEVIQGSSPFDFFIANADGTNRRLLVADADGRPSWSPGGDWIAFSRKAGPSSEPGLQASDLYLIRSDGTDIRNITATEDESPPVGSLGIMSGSNIVQQAVVSSTDVTLSTLADDAFAEDEIQVEPSWSPDGTKLAYRCSTLDTFPLAYSGCVLSLADMTTSVLADVPGRIEWSPDSAQIAFVNYLDNGNVYVADADGTNATVLRWYSTGFPVQGDAVSWRPDSAVPPAPDSTMPTARPPHEVTSVDLSNDGQVWIEHQYADTIAWSLTHGLSATTDGARTVYGRWVDAAGNISGTVAVAITLDRVPPTLTLSAPSFTNSTIVPISAEAFDATSAVTGYFLSLTGTMPGQTAPGWADAVPGTYAVPGGDGPKTIYGWVKDAAGHISAPSSAQTLLDTSSPSVNLSAPATSTTQQIEVVLSASDGGSGVNGWLLSESPEAPAADSEAWQTVKPTIFTLSPGVGLKTVYAWTRDAAGNRSAAALASVELISVPGPPTGVVATPGNGQAAVGWTAPTWDGGRSIFGYTVTSTPGRMTCATTGPLSCTVTGLTNGTPYTFTVEATNAAGTGSASAPSAAVTPTAPVVRAPDGRIRLGTGAYLGNNIYNTTGVGQAKTGAKIRGKTIKFGILIQNDSTTTADSFKLLATGMASAMYTVTYWRGTTNITAAVVAGTYATPSLAPGATYLIAVQVKVNSSATKGSSTTHLVTITSVGDSTKQDVVSFTGKRK